MQSKIAKKPQNLEKNTQIKYPKGHKMFVRCEYGTRLIEFSLSKNKTVHDYGELDHCNTALMAKTPDNKS